MKTLKIFLASSNELQTEREMMAALANSLNTVLEKQGVHVIVVQWENLDASMGVNHKQEDYNEKLRECDMCMVLYWTKFGMYTKIELETAFNELKAGHNPKKVYVYFKEDDSEVAEDLKVFRDSFPTKYGHFYTPFSNFDTLKAHFLLQFMEYQSQILPEGKGVEVKNGKVTIDGVEYVDLKNVPFAENNENRQELLEEIRETEEDLSDMDPESPRYAKKQEKLSKLQDKLRKVEEGLWATAMTITRLRTQACTERLKRAMELFEGGDSKGADAILDEDVIIRDAERNVSLIETATDGLKTSISEIQLKIRLLSCNEFNASEANITYGKKEKLYKDLIKYISLVNGQNSAELLDVYHEAEMEFSHTSQSIRSIFFLEKELELAKVLRPEKISMYCRTIIGKLVRICMDYSKLDKAIEYQKERLLLLKDAKGEDSSIYHHELLRYANMLWNTGESVEELYDKAENIASKLGGSYSEETEKAIIGYYISRGSIDKAIARAKKTDNEAVRDYLFNQQIDYYCKNRDISRIIDLLAETCKSFTPQERLSKYMEVGKKVSRVTAKALNIYDEAITQAEEMHNDEALSAIFGNMSVIFDRLGDEPKSLECLETSFEYDPSKNSIVDQLDIVHRYVRLNNKAKAFDNARKCLAMIESEDQGETWFRYEAMSKCFEALFEIDKAILYQKKSIETRECDKNNAGLWRLAKMYARYGYCDLAVKKYQDILASQSSPDYRSHTSIYRGIANAYFQSGDYFNAEKYYMMSLDVCLRAFNPDWHDDSRIKSVNFNIHRAYLNLAWFYIHGQFDKAQECIENAQKYSKRFTPEECWIQGVICCGRGEYQRAIDIFLSDRDMTPLFSQSEVIRTLIKWGKMDEAREQLSTIYDKYNDAPYVHELQGMIHKESGKYQEALDEFNRCTELRKMQYLPAEPELTRMIEEVEENIKKNG